MVTATMPTDVLDMEAAKRQERALIGALLSDRDAIATVAEWLLPGAFWDATCRTLYEAVLACWRDRIPPDPLTVYHGLRKLGIDALSIDWADVVEMVLETPWAVHAEYYGREIAAYAKRRAVAKLGQDLVTGAYRDGDFDYEAAYRAAVEEIETLVPGENAVGPVAYAELVPAVRDRLLRAWAGDDVAVETPFGFTALDSCLRGGIRPGELCLVAGRPGSGKTAFALQVAQNAGRRGDATVIFSAEMSAASLITRAIAEVSGVAPAIIETGKTDPKIQNLVLNATEALERFPIAIDDGAGITTDQMIHRLQRYQARQSVRLVIFDYIELAGDRVGRNEGEERRVSQISHQLKTLARVCDVPVIALSQLNRNVESRKDRTPQLADLRQSGSLEQDADQVLLLFRYDYYVGQGVFDEDLARKNTCDVIVGKHRNGATGRYTLHFQPETMSFKEFSR